MIRVASLVLLAGVLSVQAHAETVYVDDTLRVGVRNNPGNSEAPVEVITSGAALEVLERGDKGYVRVRTPSGAEGWVSSVYITDKAPARVLLEQVKQENARLQSELRSLSGGAPAASAASNEELEDLRKENAQLLSRVDELSQGAAGVDKNAWALRAGVLIVLFAVGVFLGKRHERQRVASRFNGLEL